MFLSSFAELRGVTENKLPILVLNPFARLGFLLSDLGVCWLSTGVVGAAAGWLCSFAAAGFEINKLLRLSRLFSIKLVLLTSGGCVRGVGSVTVTSGAAAAAVSRSKFNGVIS